MNFAYACRSGQVQHQRSDEGKRLVMHRIIVIVVAIGAFPALSGLTLNSAKHPE
ncbi:hypothetical protein [Pseudomonas congelans]|jgi:hypothetical protein|uniref:hypothetical protein n=1 Tax=Pseudomonas congelans TaxID=200452 RepID=UPI000A44EAB3|nr:hypothetical protein [Pseudomonas congelans]